MPPRRSTRAMSSSLLFDGSSEAGGPLDNVPSQAVHTAVGRGMSPGPAKYSSAYGSPPTIVPTRQNVARQRYNFSSALSHVVDAVEQDNENDARERAQREAEQEQRIRAEADRAQADHTATAARPADETLESVELVREPPSDPAAAAVAAATAAAAAAGASSQSARRKPLSAATRASRAAHAPAPAPAPEEATPDRDFALEDQVFAEAQILTPVLPARGTGVVSKTSNILQSILNSARRMSTAREAPDDEVVRRAYPQFRFIRPRPDLASAEPSPEPAADTAKPPPQPAVSSATTPAANGRAGAKSIQSRVATPGPGLRMRSRKGTHKPPRDPSHDELASNDSDVQTIASARSLLGRRRATRAPAQLVVEERPSAAAGGDVDAIRKSDAPVSPKGVLHILGSVAELTKALSLGITLLVLGFVAVRVFVITTSPATLYDGYRVDNRLHWYGRDWRSNLRQLVPFALVHPLGAISDEEFARTNGLFLSHANEIAQLKHVDRLHGDALARINRILPAMVQMDLDRHGRPVISQEFWHALKDCMQADKDIFNLIWSKDGSMAISDLQLTALQRQMQAAGFLPDPDTKALSVADVEDITAATVSKSWEAWLRQNQKRVRSILGVLAADDRTAAPSPPSPPPVDYNDLLDRLSDSQVAKLARHLAASPEAKQVLVSRQEFLQLLQSSFVEHRLEIKGEMAELEARVIEVARAAALAVSSARRSPSESSPSSTGGADGVRMGMGKREVTALVNQLVRKAISDAQLEAMARGKIKAHWDASLVKRVNFFTRNAGAVVHPHFSSPSYQVATSPFWNVRLGRGGYGGRGGGDAGGSSPSDTAGHLAPGSNRASVVFEQWEQDGDCWCGATKGSMRSTTAPTAARRAHHGARGPTDIAIKLGLRILPQYLVVEHISPSATLDPGATPRDLEVWVQIADYAQQRPLQDWSVSQFPATDDQDPLFGWGMVKVGEFAYEANQEGGSHGGVAGNGVGDAQVFRLSPDLETLDAVTDFVLVRAVSNYGNQDHTCFYRLRLYGDYRPDIVE